MLKPTAIALFWVVPSKEIVKVIFSPACTVVFDAVAFNDTFSAAKAVVKHIEHNIARASIVETILFIRIILSKCCNLLCHKFK